MALGGDVDVLAGPGSTGDKEERLLGHEVDVVLVERGIEFDHIERLVRGGGVRGQVLLAIVMGSWYGIRTGDSGDSSVLQSSNVYLSSRCGNRGPMLRGGVTSS
jgi:hypothetical protein